MRSIRSFLMALFGLLILSACGSSQGKDAEPKKDTHKLPTEIAGKSLDKWIDEIRDTDTTVRQTAIQTIVHFGPPAKKSIPVLIAALRESDATVRGDAATALGILMTGLDPKDTADAETLKKGITALSALVSDDQRYVRFRAINTVAAFGPYARTTVPNVMTSLLSSLRDTYSWEVRKASATALGRIAMGIDKDGPDTRAVKALTESLTDSCAPVRLEAINGLLSIGVSPRKAEVEAEIKALQLRLNDRDKVVALSARTLLMMIDEKHLTTASLKKLAEYFNDTDLRVRCQAANAAGMLGTRAKPIVMDVINAANDRDNELVLNAVLALGRMEDGSAVSVLSRLLKSETTHLTIRCQAARSLGALGKHGKEAIPDLTGLLSHKETPLVVACIAGLVLMGEPGLESLDDIDKLTASKTEEIKEAAKEAVKIMKKLQKKK